MKKLFLTVCAVSALTFTTVAQGERKTGSITQQEQTPEERATKETSLSATNLGLTDAQKSKFKQLVLDRIAANKPLREKGRAPSTTNEEKQTLKAQLKTNNEKFFTSVNAMLTPEQQTKWADHKKKMEAKQADKAAHQD